MPRLAAGGEVTVLDLTEGGVAGDLLALARGGGIDPLVWVLPGDLPRLDLGAGLAGDELADVLAMAVAGSGDQGAGPRSGRRCRPAQPGARRARRGRRAGVRWPRRCERWPRWATRGRTYGPGC